MSFFTAMALIFEPLRRLSNVSGQIQLLNASLKRIYTLHASYPKINTRKKPNNFTQQNTKPLIQFVEVSLKFSKEVLYDISLSIEKGQFVAFVGPSGSGKTTMLNLISRLIEPTNGQIYLDEVSLLGFFAPGFAAPRRCSSRRRHQRRQRRGGLVLTPRQRQKGRTARGTRLAARPPGTGLACAIR